MRTCPEPETSTTGSPSRRLGVVCACATRQRVVQQRLLSVGADGGGYTNLCTNKDDLSLASPVSAGHKLLLLLLLLPSTLTIVTGSTGQPLPLWAICRNLLVLSFFINPLGACSIVLVYPNDECPAQLNGISLDGEDFGWMWPSDSHPRTTI